MIAFLKSIPLRAWVLFCGLMAMLAAGWWLARRGAANRKLDALETQKDILSDALKKQTEDRAQNLRFAEALDGAKATYHRDLAEQANQAAHVTYRQLNQLADDHHTLKERIAATNRRHGL